MILKVEKFLKNYVDRFGVISSNIFPIPIENPIFEKFEYSYDKGYLDGLNWFSKNLDIMRFPAKYFKEFKSIVFFFFSYFDSTVSHNFSNLPKISIYAQYEDYHLTIRNFLKDLGRELRRVFGIKSVGFVDSSPFMERGFAFLCMEDGFLGKNGLFYLKGRGSYFFIGELLLDIESPRNWGAEKPFLRYCKNCNICVKSCPVGAIVEPGIVDSRKCISYHTIENRGVIPREIAVNLNGYIFGCDICQQVCPLNRINGSIFKGFTRVKEIEKFDLDWFLGLSKNRYEKIFKKSALSRANYYQILRNIFILAETDYIDGCFAKKIYDKFGHRKEIYEQLKELK